MNDKEMFMRFRTDIRNGGEGRRFYTDQAGLGMVERIHAEQPGLGLPGNLFPVTESVYIEDAKTRLVDFLFCLFLSCIGQWSFNLQF